jgi:exonuclease SbcC
MIEIKSIEIIDFGRHKKIKSKLKGHSIGLAGPNGRGKSTVLQAVQFALTGTIDHPDPLKAFIRRSSGDNPPAAAEVTLEFVADGKPGKIQRRITRTTVTRKLWWDGNEKPITSEGQVSDILFNILGVDKKAINSTVFIRQGEMASMFGGDVDRRDFYTRLLMLGHLAKIATTLENFRATTAASVQDLGAVRDAAQSTYEGARIYFEQCERELEDTPTVAESLTKARRVVAAYADYSEASEALKRALAKLEKYIFGDTEVTAWLDHQRLQVHSWKAEADKLQKRRGQHQEVSKALAESTLRFQNLKALAEKFEALRKAEADLAALGDIGVDPEPGIKRNEGYITKLDRKAALEVSAPVVKQAAADAQAKLDLVAESLAAIQEVYDANREVYVLARGAVNMRKDLLKGLESGVPCAESCPLCGGEAPPNPEHLKKEIAEYEQRMAAAELKGHETAARLNERKSEHAAAKRVFDAAADKLTEETQEYKRLEIEMRLTSRETVETILRDLREKVPTYHAKAFEFTRLTGEITRRKHAVGLNTPPTQNDIDAEQDLVTRLQSDLQECPWETTDVAALENAVASHRKSQDAVEAVQGIVADIEAAERRDESSASHLQNEIVAAGPTFWKREDGAVVTPEMAQAKLTELEQTQTKHDETRGRRVAANEALKAASRKIDELDLRTAEQKQRLKLVKDLEELRDTFKPSGASLDYLDYKFGRIARLAADYLSESGADFMVAASNDVALSFDFLRTDRADEVWMPQNRMSGGQKVRLAVATLRAIHAMIMPNVGLLVLDEPTTHLDEEAKRSMADMLQKIGDEGTLQMIVCDHSPTLIDAFSDRIEIPE